MAILVESQQIADRSLRHMQRRVIDRLAVVRRQLRGHLLVEGLFWTLLAAIGAAALSLALDWLLRLSLPTRLALAVVGGAAVLAVAFRRLVAPLWLRLDDLDLAELLDRRTRGVGQQISNVLQLPDLLAGADHASPGMVHAAVGTSAIALDRIDLTATLDTPRLRRLLLGCGAWLLLAVGFALLFPATASLWARRWFAGSDVRWPQATYLGIAGLSEDGHLLVPRGEQSLVQIDARPRFLPGDHPGTWHVAGRGEKLVIESAQPPQSQPPGQVMVSYRMAGGSTRGSFAVQFDESSFRYELPPLVEPAELSITGGDDWLAPIVVEPLDRPTVSSLQITATLPGSDKAQTQTVGEAGTQFLYLPQTRLELRLVADQPLASCELSDKGASVPGWLRVDNRSYALQWTMSESMALEFRLVGQRGALSSKPYFLAIGLLHDREPRLTIRSAGVGRRVTPAARIPLAVHATDDFALAALNLEV
ncbi:MAG TPA: hypothetical protein VHV08_07345, partial [Pirellulales bacterium]|nr:hypothetical protein [Pirellulales bacterium]